MALRLAIAGLAFVVGIGLAHGVFEVVREAVVDSAVEAPVAVNSADPLDTVLPDLGNPKKSDIEHAMEGHILDQTELIGTYQRAK